MAERVWTGLDAVMADGWACVVCGRSFRVRRSPARQPVGRSHTGSQVFACVGNCAARAAATAELVVIPDQRAELRITARLDAPAAVRFVSCEPLRGPVWLRRRWLRARGLDWVIVGGESGPGARSMPPQWARSLRRQCHAAGVAFFLKQWGRWRLLNGRTYEEFPGVTP